MKIVINCSFRTLKSEPLKNRLSRTRIKKDFVIIQKLLILVENRKLYFHDNFQIYRTLRTQVIKEKQKFRILDLYQNFANFGFFGHIYDHNFQTAIFDFASLDIRKFLKGEKNVRGHLKNRDPRVNTCLDTVQPIQEPPKTIFLKVYLQKLFSLMIKEI